MMTQYAYLRTNKISGNIHILFGCNLLYMMTQYAYLRTNKFNMKLKFYLVAIYYIWRRSRHIYEIIIWKEIQDSVLRRSLPIPRTGPRKGCGDSDQMTYLIDNLRSSKLSPKKTRIWETCLEACAWLVGYWFQQWQGWWYHSSGIS